MALAGGDALTFTVLQMRPVAGDSFTLDNLSVAADTGGITPPTLHATAGSSTEIDLGWGAIPGAVGYHVFRDGAGAPTATVDAPVDELRGHGLDPGSTHTYTVTAFDGRRNRLRRTRRPRRRPGRRLVGRSPPQATSPANPTTPTTTAASARTATASRVRRPPSSPRAHTTGCSRSATSSTTAHRWGPSTPASTSAGVGTTARRSLSPETTRSGAQRGQRDRLLGNATGYYTYFANHGVGRRGASTVTATTATTSAGGTCWRSTPTATRSGGATPATRRRPGCGPTSPLTLPSARSRTGTRRRGRRPVTTRACPTCARSGPISRTRASSSS